jgi:hypothetical protein
MSGRWTWPARSTVGVAEPVHYRAGMSSDGTDDRTAGDGARHLEANEIPTAELPVLVAAEPVTPAVVTGRAHVGWPAMPLVSPTDATVPIVFPANLLGDGPVERPSLLVMIAVHGTFLVIAIVLVLVLMAMASL